MRHFLLLIACLVAMMGQALDVIPAPSTSGGTATASVPMAIVGHVSGINDVLSGINNQAQSYTSIDVNNYGMWSPVNPTRVTIKRAGVYHVACRITFNDQGDTATSEGRLLAVISKNGSMLTPHAAGPNVGTAYINSSGLQYGHISTHINLAMDDYLECVAYQTTGATLTASRATFSVVYVADTTTIVEPVIAFSPAPTAYYKFNVTPLVDPIADNSVAANRPLTVTVGTGLASASPGVESNYLSMSGTAFDIKQTSGYTITSSGFTVAGWVYVTGPLVYPSGTGIKGLWATRYGSGGEAFEMFMVPQSASTFCFSYAASGCNLGPFPVDTWHSLVHTLESGAQRACADGGAKVSLATGYPMSGTTVFRFGNYCDYYDGAACGGVVANGALQGRFDEVGVWENYVFTNTDCANFDARGRSSTSLR